MNEEDKCPDEDKDSRITIRLDDEMYAAVERVRKRKRWIRTQVVKDALVQMLESEGELPRANAAPQTTTAIDLETR